MQKKNSGSGMDMKRPSSAKKILNSVVAAAAAFAASEVSYAACSANRCTDEIGRITVTDTAVYLELVNGTVGLTTCTPYSGSAFTLPKSNDNYQSYYAALLAAYYTKEPITLRAIDGSPNCSLSYIAVP